MKEYDEENFGINYHVIEYDSNDLYYGNVITEIFKCMIKHKYEW